MGEFFRRLLYLLTQRRHDRELQEEMAAHREMQREASGEMTPREARAAFGDDLRLREDAREAWGWMWLDRLRQDLQYAVRVLRRSPSFTVAAVLILALGIGVNLAAFHLLNVIAFKPLPVRDPDSLIRLTPKTDHSWASSLSYPALEFYARHNTVLSAVLGATYAELAFGPKASERLRARFVTPNFFTELGGSAAHGRVLTPASDHPAAPPVAVLGYGFWTRQFGSDAAIVGNVIHLNEKPVLVAGVAAHDFTGLAGDDVDVWLTISTHPYFFEGSTILTDFAIPAMQMWGRLRPGVTPKQAEESSKPLAAELRRVQPSHIKEGEYLSAAPGGYLTDLSDAPMPILLVLALLVLLILVVACANLGNLMLARAASREREIATRLAVGAGRARIVRQLLTESLLLAFLGAGVGMLLSVAMVRFVTQMLDVPRYFQFTVDWRVVLVALALSALATILFGLTPALAATRPPNRTPRARARRVLIAVQVAASCILLVVGGLMVRSMRQAFATHPGYDYERIVWLDPGLGGRSTAPEDALNYMAELRERLLQIPGVESVALCDFPPMGNGHMTLSESATFPGIQAQGNRVDRDYFRTLAIPLLAGRNFTDRDKPDVVIISDTLAQKLWPGQDPLGKRFLGTVVGVVGRARTVVQGDPESLQVYFPLQSREMANAVVMVKTAGAPEVLVETLRSAARGIDTRTIPQLTLMRDAFRMRMQSSHHGGVVLSAMGLLATLLAAAGVYGLVCYTVVQRQKEIGIRIALGARSGHVVALMLRQFYVPVGMGAVIGLAGAAAISIVIRGLLFGISHLDPLSYVGAVGFFAVLAGIAALIPARRALRVNPMEVLRHE